MKMRASATAREAGSGTKGMMDVDGLAEDQYVEGKSHELVQQMLAMMLGSPGNMSKVLLYGKSGVIGGAIVARVAESGRAKVCCVVTESWAVDGEERSKIHFIA
jgi:hypothetical protein